MQSLSHPSYNKGATLIELMISLAIVAILLTAVAPNVQSILIRNRITGEINELSGAIQFARNNAIDEQADTVICPSSDFSTCGTDWNDPKIVFMDLDGDGDRGDDEDLLLAINPTSDANILTGPSTSIRFQDNGAISTAATLLLCNVNKEDTYARALTISLQGRVKLSRDSDGDDVHEDNSGNPLDCG